MSSSLISPIALAYALLLATALLTGCNTGSNFTPEEHISRAKEYQDKGEIRAAIIELKNALQKTPDNQEARWLLAQVYVKVGNGPAAEKELKQALRLGLAPETAATSLARVALMQGKFQDVTDASTNYPGLSENERAELLALQGHAYLGLHEFEKAEKLYDSALSLQPNVAEANLGKAEIAAAQKRFDKAREWLDKILQTSPAFAPAWSLLGDLERYQGNAEAAEQAYGEAITHRFNNAEDLLNRTLIRIYLKNYEGATDDLGTLKKQGVNHPGVAYTEGLLDFQQNKYADALAAFQKSLRQNSKYMPAVFYAGLSYYMQGQFKQAEQHLSQFLARFPHSDIAAKALAAARLRRGDYTGAESVLESVLNQNPDDIAALDLMGNVVLGQGKPEQSTTYFQKITTQAPDSAAAYMKLGLSFMMSGEHEQGIDTLEKAIELDSQLPQADLLVILGHLRAREFDKALTTAERLQEKQPQSPLPLNLIGGVYLGKGEETKAQEAFHEALEIAPGNPSATHNLAALALKKGDIEKARSFYQETLKHHPGHLRTLLKLGALETQQGHVEKAKTWVEQAMGKNPKALAPRILLARYYLDKGKPTRSLALIREVQALYPNHPSLLAVMGTAQLATNQPTNGIETLQKLVEAQPQSAQAHYLLAKAYSATNNVDKLRGELNQALELDPNHALSKIAMTHLLMHENKPNEANKLFQELKQAYPEHPEVLAQEGWLAMRQNQPQKAVAAFKEALKHSPTSQIIVNLALAQFQAGNQDRSLATLEDWLKKHPEDMLAQYNLANLYLALKQEQEAVSAFAKVVEQAPNNVTALNNLAWLLRKDDPAKALTYAERALDIAPNSPPVMDTLGMLLLEKGETKRGLSLLAKASNRTPKNPDIRYHFALALARNGEKSQAQQVLNDLLDMKQPFAEEKEARDLLQALDN
ncbi:PEP-CTERM system TPR-repeat lipoprotein [Nitrosococcus halophilus Nc 4]|uniref:PEP-CTERM system TPR-repeat lipoprotein n=1 Tax=Nitrosococcus halophilus (strain Nc4) TaxID=472759 RepID=D5C048_NITHN|nr:XrtA/PEP-CTERM system TPR-repeat protein PrsT [Nitrosococcus halophilus]ADE16295.1 PEP-CTERM system TPR-repeat lipoprotein [Nitrosococcus halophilus Nc 4]